MIKQYLNGLDIKANSKRIYLSTIREILDLAIDDGAIKDNPSLNIKLGTDTKIKINYFSKEEEITLIANANEPLKTHLQIAFSTGMRHEEILGLKFSDIQDGFVKIQRVKTRSVIYDMTKTEAGERTIPFDVDIEHIKGKSFYLFPDIKDVSYFRSSWRNLLKKCDIRHRGIKNTRHTFATHLLKDEVVSISELSGLLGHVKVSTTLTFYASVIDSKNDNVKEKLKNYRHDIGTLGKSLKYKKA